MPLLPAPLKLSLLAQSFALILSGLGLVGAAFLRNSALIAASTGLFLLLAIGGTLMIGRQIRQVLREKETGALDEFMVFEDVTAGQIAPPADPFAFSDDLFPAEQSTSDEDEALRRIEKAQAVDRLRDGITHDLNNRLMVISANIDAAARQLKDQPVLQRKLLSALVAADQAAKLIARSTAFARQGEAKVQYVNIAEQVRSIADLLSRSLLRDTVELRLALAEDTWSVEADPDDIQTAIVALSGHVRDALPQGGTITLEARNVWIDKGSLPDLSREGEFVQLTIRGSGGNDARPVPEADLEQAFVLRDLDLSSWFSLRRSLHFLDDLGGASQVRRDGTGTSIILYLQRAAAATLLPSDPPGEDDAPEEPVPSHMEVLVVDDELEVALALQASLEEFGYATSIATDAAQAMKSLSARRPALVLVDVAMPGTMNGIMLAREMRRIFPAMPVLLITGSPIAADESSEFPLLQKPIVSRDLHAAIQRHMKPQGDSKVIPFFPRPSRQAR